MAKPRRAPKDKKINPTLFVFCEGATEVAYVNLLKSLFRIPSIHIHPKTGGNSITTEYIEHYKKDKPTHEKDMNFLMYDLDVATMLPRLSKIKDSILVVSNPCIELWFLLHYKSQTANINSADCCRQLSNRNQQYKKGIIDVKLREKLISKKEDAVSRAKSLNDYDNPSSTIYKLIEVLNGLRK